MQIIIFPSKRSIISSSLNTFNLAKFKKILGPERIRQYEANNYNLRTVYDFLSGNLKGGKKLGTFNNILGMEFNAYVVEYLNENGIRNIKIEQDIGTTRVDTYANFNRPVPFKYVKLDGSMEDVYLLGNHSIENKAARKIPGKAIKQIKKARGYYNKNAASHVLVLKDTLIDKEKHRIILEEGGDVLRADITRDQLINRINSLKIKMKAM